MSEGQIVGIEGGLGGWSCGSWPESGQSGNPVEIRQPRHALQVHGTHRIVVRDHVDAACDRGAAAPGDDADTGGAALCQDGRHLGRIGGTADAVRQRRHQPASESDHVHETLSAAMGEAIQRIGRNVCGERGEPSSLVVRRRGRTGRHGVGRRPGGGLEPLDHPLRWGIGLALEAPTTDASLTSVCHDGKV